MATVYSNKAVKNSKGVIFAPGKCESSGKYLIFKLCENYAGHVRGGIAKTWRYIAKDLTLEEAKSLLAKKAKS